MQNIKRVALFVVLSLTFFSVAAQDDRSKAEFRARMGYDFSVDKGGGGTISLLPEIGWNLNDQFYFGIVSGIQTNEKFKYLSIPVFVHPELLFNVPGEITPFFGLEGGIAVDTMNRGNGIVSGAISPMLGIKTPIGSNTDFSLSFGYTRTIVSGGGGNSLGFKAGINLGTHKGTGRFRRFMSRCLQSIELETMTVAKSEDSSGNLECGMKERAVLGLHYSLLFPTVDNLYLGPSIALGICNDKWDSHIKGDDPDWEGIGCHPYGYLVARARYQAKQFTIAGKFYPYAQVETGLVVFNYASFACNAAIGISYGLGSDNSIDLSIGYNTMNVESAGDDDCGENKGVLRIAVGYSF